MLNINKCFFSQDLIMNYKIHLNILIYILNHNDQIIYY